MSNILDLPTKVSLKVEALIGDDTFPFNIEFPNWDYAEKLEKGEEFFKTLEEIDKAIAGIIEKANEAPALSNIVFATLGKEVQAIENFKQAKEWIKNNALAFTGLSIKISEEEKITTIRKEHELFGETLNNLWSYDCFVTAMIGRIRKHFNPSI